MKDYQLKGTRVNIILFIAAWNDENDILIKFQKHFKVCKAVVSNFLIFKKNFILNHKFFELNMFYNYLK